MEKIKKKQEEYKLSKILYFFLLWNCCDQNMWHKQLKEKNYLIWIMALEVSTHSVGEETAENGGSRDSQEEEEEAAEWGPGMTVFL